jgi:hypothetical protein
MPNSHIDSTPASCGTQNGPEIDPRSLGLFKIGYSVNEVLSLLPIGRTALYDSVNRGELNIRKHGKKTVILAVDLARFIHRLGNPETKAPKAAARNTTATEA